MICVQRVLGRGQIVVLRRQTGEAGFQLFDFAQGVEVHAADAVDLRPQVGDFGLDLLAGAPVPRA